MRLNTFHTGAAPRRKPPHTPWFRRIALAGIAIGLGLGGTAAWMWRDALLLEALEASGRTGLRLERIELEGRLNTDRDAIMKAAKLEWYQPMLGIELETVHDRLLGIGWVGGVRVERRLPDTLVITLEERQALALYQDDDGHRVIDRRGVVINDVAAEDFTHLPVVKGQDAPAHAQAILSILKQEPELFAEVWSLTYQSGRRWDVFLRNNIRIQLPETDPGQAWSKLAEMDRDHKLTDRDVVNIDLRIPGKLVIRPIRSNKGSNT